MLAWFEQIIPNLIGSVSPFSLCVIVIVGILTSFTPCTLSLVPIIIAYVGGTHTTRKSSFIYSFVFALGTATTFMLLGFFVAAFGGLFGSRQSILYYSVALVCLLVGLNLLGLLPININYGSTLLNRFNNRGIGGSYLLGLTTGLVGSQCGTPILMVILAVVLTQGQWLYGGVLLFLYGLGRAVPIIICGTFAGFIKHMEIVDKYNNAIEKIAGFLILGMSIYFIYLA